MRTFAPPGGRFVCEGRLGRATLWWVRGRDRKKIFQVELAPGAGPPSREDLDIPPELTGLGELLRLFLNGREVKLPLDLLYWERLSLFQRQVLSTVSAIPWGRVSSYQLVAQSVGRPRAVRAVGQALARNPFPLFIPCHRVIRADGRLGGFHPGRSFKQALLEAEGWILEEDGRLRSPIFHMPPAPVFSP